MEAPGRLGPPAWVREFQAAKKFRAPGRDKIRRVAPGKVPDGSMRWSEGGTQSAPAGADGARLAPVTAAAATADDNVAAPGLGLQPHYGVEEFAIREHLSAGVNLANGNLVVKDTDLKINAPGLATQSDRFYNGLSSRRGMFGQRWSMAGGRDVGLEIGTSTVTLRGPSGFRAVFTGSGSTWTAPSWFRGKLIKQTDGSWTVISQGSGMRLRFDGGGYLIGHQDRNGLGLHYTYNTDGTTASVKDAAGRVVTYTYVNGRVRTMTDSAGRVYSYDYDYDGQLISSTNPDGNNTSYGYDSAGRLSRITTARGVRVDFGYDSVGRVTSVSRYTGLNGGGEKQSTTFAYPNATTTTQTNANGKTWTYTRDSAGRITQVKDPLGRVRSQAWTANSAVQGIDPMGAGGTGSATLTSYSYDAANNPTQVKMPTGAVSSAVYSTSSSCAGTAAPNKDRPTCLTDDANNRTTMSYDAYGNMTSSQDTTPDAAGKATDGAKLSYTYQRPYAATTGTDCGGKPGQVCGMTDGKGGKTSYTYDGDGNLIKAAPSAPLGERRFEYDSLGRLTASINGRGQRVTYEYDAQDRLLSTTVPPADGVAARTIYKSYDADGNVNFNDSVISYDAQNRQDYIKDPAGVEFSTWFDAAGNMLGVSGAGQDYRYSYNAANELTTAGLTGATCSQDTTGQASCVKFAYDAAGREIKRFLPNATVIETTYDNSGRITRVRAVNGATARFDTSWSYKAGGTGTDRTNVQTRTDTVGVTGAVNHGSVTTYGYDTTSHLTSAVEKTSAGKENAKWVYAYDKAGNRTTQTRTGSTQSPTGTLTYGYNAANELTTINGNSDGLSYDADGNETANPGEDWLNVAKRNSTISPTGDVTTMNTTLGGTSATYNYGYGGTNPGDYLLTSMRGKTLNHSLTGIAAMVDDGGGTLHVMRAPSGKPLAITRAPGEVGYYVQDRQGSVMGILSGSGLATVSYAYDPYGNIRSAPGADAPVAWYNPITYAGGIKDHQTGLTRFGVRWYDPNTGRYTTPDPTAQEGNAYLYAGGNPCNKTDRTGGHHCTTAATIGAGVIATGAGIAFLGALAGEIPSVGTDTPATVAAGLTAAGSYTLFLDCVWN